MNSEAAKIDPLGWRTADEVCFLENLGRHGSNGLSRRELLLKYLTAAKKRKLWERVNSERVIQHARELLHTAA